MNSGRLAKFILIALLFLLPFTTSAQATTYNVASVSEWQTAMDNAVTNDIINITASFTLSSDLASLFAVVTIQGNNFTIDGGGQFTAIIVGNNSAGGTINNLTLANNKGGAGTHGGAIQYQNGSSLTLNNVTIRNSRSSSGTADGGGLQCQRPNLTIRNSRIHDNSGRKGGGLNLDNGCTNAQIINSSIYNNTSTGNGGGIHVDAGASVTISNSSIFGNTSAHRGGGIYMDGGGTLTLNHVTITGNTTTDAQGSASSDTGAGLRMYSGTLHIRHSIIYGNTLKGNAENCRLHSAVTVGTLSNNMIGAGSDSACTTNSDPADPQLVGPSVHGRGSFYIPRAGSPAIDAVTCLASTIAGYNVDQRGQPRPLAGQSNSQCDAGAIEHPGYVPPPPPSDDGGGSSGGSGGGSGDSGSSQSEAPRGALAPTSTCLLLGPEVVVNDATVGTACQVVEPSGYGHSDLMKAEAMPSKVVDVWGWVTPDTEVCFQGGGSIKFVDTMASSRTISTLPAVGKDGMVCAMIKGAGQVAHVPGPAPSQAQDPPPKAAPQPTAIPSRSLSDCMVKANYLLNMRDAPAGAKIGEVAWNATLTALERTPGWIKVDNMGKQGWIAAMYVEPKGNCA